MLGRYRKRHLGWASAVGATQVVGLNRLCSKSVLGVLKYTPDNWGSKPKKSNLLRKKGKVTSGTKPPFFLGGFSSPFIFFQGCSKRWGFSARQTAPRGPFFDSECELRTDGSVAWACQWDVKSRTRGSPPDFTKKIPNWKILRYESGRCSWTTWIRFWLVSQNSELISLVDQETPQESLENTVKLNHWFLNHSPNRFTCGVLS